jgi:DNA-binding transcriptional regulator GbsR (MarR family)
MSEKIIAIHESVIETVGRISAFWGFSKIMGQLYALLYLSPKPLTLDSMAESLSISKGNVSINIRNLLRWNMVQQVWVKGDRKDYYEAEIDFWKIIRGVLQEREKKEFSQALASIGGLRQKTKELKKTAKTTDIAFTEERLKNLEEFIANMDKIVSVFITIEDLKKNFWSLAKKA